MFTCLPPAVQMGTWRNFDYAFLFSLKARLWGCVEYGYSILGPVSKRTFVKWCFLEKEKDFPTHFYYPYSFLS